MTTVDDVIKDMVFLERNADGEGGVVFELDNGNIWIVSIAVYKETCFRIGDKFEFINLKGV